MAATHTVGRIVPSQVRLAKTDTTPMAADAALQREPTQVPQQKDAGTPEAASAAMSAGAAAPRKFSVGKTVLKGGVLLGLGIAAGVIFAGGLGLVVGIACAMLGVGYVAKKVFDHHRKAKLAAAASREATPPSPPRPGEAGMSDAAPGAATALRATPNSKPSNTLTVADTPAAQTPRPHVRAAPPGTSAYARPDHAPFFQEKETPGFFKCTADWRGQLWGLAGAVVGGLVGLTLGPIGSAALSVGLAVLMGGVAAKRHQRHQQRDIQQENTVRRALDDALNDTFDPARAPVALSALQQFVTQLAPAFKTPFRKEIASVLHGALLPLLMSESTSPDVKESVKALLEVLGKLSTLEAKGSASRKLAPKVKEFLAAADTARENASSAASKPPTPGATKQNDLVPVSGRTQRTPMALNGQPTVGAGTKPVSSLSGYAHAPRHPPVAPPLPSAAPGYSAAARAA